MKELKTPETRPITASGIFNSFIVSVANPPYSFGFNRRMRKTACPVVWEG
jgi:hypothetical protein